ncbi:MAG: DUF5687 family protein, partial [Bacteroidota bacterium]
MLTFLWHQLLGAFRGVFWQKNLVMAILTGFMYTYLAFMIVLLGFFADRIILVVIQGADIVQVGTEALIYYFLLDLLIRFLFQKTQGVTIQYYALLPVNKSKLLHFPLIVSSFSLFNWVPIIVITTFFVREVTGVFSWLWWILMLSLIFLNNFLNLILRYTFRRWPILVMTALAIPVLLLVIAVLDFTDVGEGWLAVVYAIEQRPRLIFLPLALVVVAYVAGYRVMRVYYYPDTRSSSKVAEEKETGFWSWLHRYGIIGRLVEIEMKMILRNKRPRVMLIMTSVIMLYLSVATLGTGNHQEAG